MTTGNPRLARNVGRLVLGLAGLLAATATPAVCLDPHTLASGYHASLDLEVVTSEFIAVGVVVGAQILQEDPDDAYGITAHRYTVRLERLLKGELPATIALRSENTTSRYTMAVGERHLLFLSRVGDHFVADNCGNSATLPGADAARRAVEEALYFPRVPPPPIPEPAMWWSPAHIRATLLHDRARGQFLRLTQTPPEAVVAWWEEAMLDLPESWQVTEVAVRGDAVVLTTAADGGYAITDRNLLELEAGPYRHPGADAALIARWRAHAAVAAGPP